MRCSFTIPERIWRLFPPRMQHFAKSAWLESANWFIYSISHADIPALILPFMSDESGTRDLEMRRSPWLEGQQKDVSV